MRKLASIQIITDLNPIEGADQIEVASILGWKVVVKKGEFKINDKVVYCEIDCLMPDRPEFEFLKPIGMRIKTVRLRGQVSQGICFPLSILNKINPTPDLRAFCIDDDVTDILGITQYQDVIPPDLMGKAKGYIPSAIPKSSITRIQTLQERLDKFKGTLCYYTEKLDGESITFYIKDNVFGVCSKEVDFLETEDSAHWNIAKSLDIENKLRSMNCNFSLQGEMVGEGIKKNKYKLKGRHVFFYNAFEVDKYRYFNYTELIEVMNKLNLKIVPVLSYSFVLSNNIDELVELSIGTSKLSDTQREGIVVCPLTELSYSGDRVIFKVISPKFLIKHGE